MPVAVQQAPEQGDFAADVAACVETVKELARFNSEYGQQCAENGQHDQSAIRYAIGNSFLAAAEEPKSLTAPIPCDTEREMHHAWRKRAEEAEAEAGVLKAGLEAFEKEMREKTVPEIVAAVKRRAQLAREYRGELFSAPTPTLQQAPHEFYAGNADGGCTYCNRLTPDGVVCKTPTPVAEAMPTLAYVCLCCGTQQHADGICANCECEALVKQPIAEEQEGEGT
jgi:hypothetical protein